MDPRLKNAIIESLRLTILQNLLLMNQYTLDAVSLRNMLAEQGRKLSSQDMTSQIDWLAGQELVTVETVGANLRIATLTDDGIEVAQGLLKKPGVRRPLPSEQ